MEETKNVISFANVGTRYDGGREVLSDVSFNINSHSFYFLTGASGAGKTTLLKMIHLSHRPSRGQIKLFGVNTAMLSRDAMSDLRRKISFVSQDYNLISHLSVFDNIALPLRVRGVSETRVNKLVAKILEWVGMGQYANSRPMSLSGGQQQKIAVARAVITQPEILLADEPTGNLDDDSAAKLMNLFIQMNKTFGTAVIIATHSQTLLDAHKFPRIAVADHRVAFMNPNGAEIVEPRVEIPKTPAATKNYFAELSMKFQDMGGES